MTRILLFPAGAALLGLMVSCGSAGPPAAGTGTQESFGPGFPTGSAAWSAKEREIYRAAYDAGSRDQAEGYRYDDDRVTAPLDKETRGFSRQGYRNGYYHDQAVRRAARPAADTGAGATEVPGPVADALALPVTPKPEVKTSPPRPDPFAVPLEPQ